MRKLAILALVATLASARPARAACHLHTCPDWLEVIGWGLALGLVGGYAAGTGAFIYRDIIAGAGDTEQSINYGGTELGVNGSLALLFGGAAIDEARHGNSGGAAFGSALALVHTGLAVHGGMRVYEHRDQIRMPDAEGKALIALAYGTNTLLWAAIDASGPHGRGYGVAEALVNAPLAVGLGYLAYDRASNWHGGAALGYGALSAVSGALVIHGLRTALHHEANTPGLDVEPAVVSDGIELAPGMSASRSW